MDCPYCKKDIYGMTGLQEIMKFEKHLPKCKKNPNNIVLSDGQRTAVVPINNENMMDALEIRAKSGQ